MNETTRKQAREIMDTVRILQKRLFLWYSERVGAALRPELCVELSLPQLNMLHVVRDHQQATIKELAETLKVSPPSASAMVDRLVEMNLLVREQGREDRREVHVRLSDLGKMNLQWHEEQFLEAITELMERLGPELTQEWCCVYAHIREVLLETPGMGQSQEKP